MGELFRSTMLQWKHLRRPMRTAQIAMGRLRAHLNARRFASHSRRYFGGDSRYDPKNVAKGFASRYDRSGDDTSVLERICGAYARAVSRPESASACYGPTDWWKNLRQDCLGPVMKALRKGDVAALRRMYANFFRDPCTTGLVGVPSDW